MVMQGPGGVLVSAAVGALSLGSRAVEWTCDAADTLYSKTPVGAAPFLALLITMVFGFNTD